ncbi:hypothetical protein BKA70DRAFT_1563616 [Coprinopsis sp. MPI-PUGE-AT-0042]|nr:hypothetical protein BKA70DRAFT_1563616 [Coprinopsis sp. MPI-PUGE-AT-0042]
MADAEKGFFKGTSAEQDRRFSDKELKLMKSMKFPPEFDKKVSRASYESTCVKSTSTSSDPWVAKKIVELIGIEDEVVVEYAMGLLEDESKPCVPRTFGRAEKEELRKARENDARAIGEGDRRRLDEFRGGGGGGGGRGGSRFDGSRSTRRRRAPRREVRPERTPWGSRRLWWTRRRERWTRGGDRGRGGRGGRGRGGYNEDPSRARDSGWGGRGGGPPPPLVDVPHHRGDAGGRLLGLGLRPGEVGEGGEARLPRSRSRTPPMRRGQASPSSRRSIASSVSRSRSRSRTPPVMAKRQRQRSPSFDARGPPGGGGGRGGRDGGGGKRKGER